MSKKLNERFLDAYLALDHDLSEKLGLSDGGLSAYVTRLNNAKYAPGRDEVLPRLVRYRNVRTKLAHGDAPLRGVEQIFGDDVKWLKNFTRAVSRKRDPLSLYLRRARANEKRKNAKCSLVPLLLSIGVVIVAAVVLYFILR